MSKHIVLGCGGCAEIVRLNIISHFAVIVILPEI